MKKLIIGFTAVIVAVILFTGGVFASQWLSFTGGDCERICGNSEW